MLYSSVDAILIPSRVESFGQIACEAGACEAPVVAFKTGGIQDIIKHYWTGYLAEQFNTDDFVNGIKWVLKNSKNKSLGSNARAHIKDNFDGKLVAQKYLNIYNKICNS